VSTVKYDLGFYIPEDDILHSHRRGNLKSYQACSCSNYAGSEKSDSRHAVNCMRGALKPVLCRVGGSNFQSQ
jgi:hypothetical protein